uniref:NADH-ubiquinone oxidoreductase chain 5 n=1 Tax=Naupactus xanthographus TaxID=114905 RepID=D8WKQ7_NAUXA|nr:NADH dehydrogenase subunit 5 [Naupactus xanthographus]ACZ58590.1 NADH dehydrogenase subunit 5 [Naupactus xanthographus]
MSLSLCKIYFFFFMILSFLLFFSGLYFLILDLTVFIEFNILSLNSVSILMTILFDWMSLLFMSFVLFISSMVINYSEDYMHGDKYLNRFILLVVMFVLSMMFLIISPNLISILLGWDGLGLVSYVLVIYYQNVKSNSAGMLTALSNRIGDAALLISIAWMLNFGSWNYIFYMDFMFEDKVMGLISMFIVLAAITKSAQIPFSSWLPAAMAAPTPVSSLVHSSTLVTAGVYLLIRFNMVFSSFVMNILLYISLMTMFMAGLGANFEFDLKKIIALSTLSQLGLMISILALGSYELAFFHLLTHALFKALLFMCAGMIIHNLGNCQDIRFMGGLVSFMPLTCLLFNICNLSLCGLPFLSGFYSKDLIIEFMSMGYLNLFVYIVYYISIGLTACYSFRLVYYSLVGEFNLLSLNNLNEESKIMLKGMSGLIIFVVVMGSILMWVMFPTPYYICLPLLMKMMALLMIMIGIWVGYECSKFKISYLSSSFKFMNLSNFLAYMWNMPFLSTFGINFLPLNVGKIYLKSFDQGWMEYYGGQNLLKSLNKMSKSIQFLSLNYLKISLLLVLIWVFFISVFLNF